MNIAYLISAHTDAPQLKRLTEALHRDAEFFIHIDLKSNLDDFTSILSNPHVHFIPHRVDVAWGTFTEVEYQMHLLGAAVDFPKHFDHIFFLSGMDFPLWSTEHITEWLKEHKEQEQLQGLCMENPLLNDQQRMLYTTLRPFSRHRKWAILKRKVLHALGKRKKLHFYVNGQKWSLYKGSAWWCISEELAAEILYAYKHLPELKHYFRDSFCPAETVIQTIAFNHPRWRNRCLLTEGEYPGLAALTPLHFIDYDPVIKVLDETDYPRLTQSGKMFCRKVVSGKSDKLVELILKQRK